MPNQNNDKPDQAVARFLKDHLLSFKEIMFESSKQQDNIAVWLVGMSTGSIALIISQFGKFNPTLYLALKISVLFLAATIILGLLFRIFHLFLQDHNRNDLMRINGWLAGYSEFSTEVPIELPEGSSAQFIALCLYNYVGIDVEPEFIESVKIEGDVEHWRNQYEEYAKSYRNLEEAKDQVVEGMVENFHEFLARLEGVSPQQFKQTIENDKSMGIRKRRLKKSCNIFYILMCISFAVSVSFISCSFISMDLKVNHSSAPTDQKAIAPSKQIQPIQTDKSD